MNLTGQSRVVADGDEIGELAGVHLNPATNQIVELVVRGPGRQALIILVPVAVVEDATADEVRLTISAEKCRMLSAGHPRAVPSLFRAVSRQVQCRELDFGATVHCLDGPVGTLQHILYDQYTYDVEELVIGASEWLDHEVAVPFDWVREVHRDRLVLSGSRQEVISMPPAPEDR